ncbi:hypothetical protein B0H10DRAFT_1945947 [Mycena sp. CBHHK59/15]|nr:hypothetical protein B0H10DRAFT_1945947 [Mycena sp. CBHHK59/15]
MWKASNWNPGYMWGVSSGRKWIGLTRCCTASEMMIPTTADESRDLANATIPPSLQDHSWDKIEGIWQLVREKQEHSYGQIQHSLRHHAEMLHKCNGVDGLALALGTQGLVTAPCQETRLVEGPMTTKLQCREVGREACGMVGAEGQPHDELVDGVVVTTANVDAEGVDSWVFLQDGDEVGVTKGSVEEGNGNKGSLSQQTRVRSEKRVSILWPRSERWHLLALGVT